MRTGAAALLLLSFPALGQQQVQVPNPGTAQDAILQQLTNAVNGLASSSRASSVTLDISGSAQPAGTTAVTFGKLPGYAIVMVDICSPSTQSLTVPLARVRQQIKMPKGVTLISTAMAASVVADAQGRTPLLTFTRIFTGVAGFGAGALAVKAVPPGTWTSGTVLTVEGIALLLQYIFPALQTHAIQTIASQMLPETLNFTPVGCIVPGYSVVAIDKTVKEIPDFKAEVTVLVAPASKAAVAP